MNVPFEQLVANRMRRRTFLATAAALPLAYGLRAGASEAKDLAAPPSSAAVPPGAAEGWIVREAEPQNLEYPFSSLSGMLTPNERFYVRSHFKAPDLKANAWRLKVEGAVERPFEIGYDELLKMPSKTAPVTLECAGNGRVFLTPKVEGAQWQLGAAGTAEWAGVPLAALLERAGVTASAVEVVLEGADSGTTTKPSKPADAFHYARSLPLARARGGDVLLAHHMNGKPLPPTHGFPLRAVVPGWYGMASVKWLTRVVVVERPFNGYFQTVDYAYWQKSEGLPPVRVPVTEMQVKAQIARPASGEVVRKGVAYRVYGAAWTGDSTVTKVEVSADGGKTYAEAKLIGDPVPHAWRLWEWTWKVPAAAGRCTLTAKATDARGMTQPVERDKDRETYMISHLVPIEVEVE